MDHDPTLFIEFLSRGLTDDQKRQLMPSFNGGIVLPNRDFNPEDIIGRRRPVTDDPQG